MFHELQYEYPGLPEDIKRSGLQGHNFWKEVQDFKWIKKEKSPNFSLVFDGKEKAPEEEEQPVFHNPTHSVPAQIIKLEEPSKAAVHCAPVEETRTIINSDNFELPKQVQYGTHHITETKAEPEKPKPEPEKPKAEPVKPAENDDDDDIDEL